MIRVVFSKNMEGIHGEVKYQRMYGNSADSKPTSGLATGSRFVEVNTGKQYIYNEANQTWTEVPTGGGSGGGDVSDVRVNNVSVVSYGVANIPVAGSDTFGVMKVGSGLAVDSSNKVYVNGATSVAIKAANDFNSPIVPGRQDESVFYGLAVAAGDTSQAASSNEVGNYTDTAKYLIRKMIGAPADWELINTITTTEDLESVYVDVDSYGNSFYLTDMFAQVSLPATTTGTRDYIGTRLKVGTSTGLQTIEAPTTRYMTETSTGWIDVRAEAIVDTVYSWARMGSSQRNTQGINGETSTTVSNEYLTIAGFGLAQYSASSTLIPAGTVIKVYGKRDFRV